MKETEVTKVTLAQNSRVWISEDLMFKLELSKSKRAGLVLEFPRMEEKEIKRLIIEHPGGGEIIGKTIDLPNGETFWTILLEEGKSIIIPTMGVEICLVQSFYMISRSTLSWRIILPSPMKLI
jgi:hypothetical protein